MNKFDTEQMRAALKSALPLDIVDKSGHSLLVTDEVASGLANQLNASLDRQNIKKSGVSFI